MKIDNTSNPAIAAIAATQTQLNSYNSVKPAKDENAEKPADKKQISAVTNPNDKVTIQIDISKSTLDTLQKVGNVSELLFTTAQNIRKTDQSLSAGSELISKMKEQLGRIIKQYPPYPPDDRDRMEILMSYSGLQKQITSLMVPPPPPPVYEKVQHLWENLLSNQTKSIQTPQLPTNVPDSHIKAAAGQLDNLQSQIGLVQEALGNSVKGL